MSNTVALKRMEGLQDVLLKPLSAAYSSCSPCLRNFSITPYFMLDSTNAAMSLYEITFHMCTQKSVESDQTLSLAFAK